MSLARRVRAELGAAGVAGAVLLAAGLGFLALVLEPLEEQDRRLGERLEQQRPARGPAPRAGVLRAGDTPAAQLAAFHAWLDRGKSPPEWLRQLDALAREAGIELGSAEYQMRDAGTALRRYEIVLPVSGTYGELRTFLEALLAQIPVLSLDGLTLARESAREARMQAELHLTLHLVRR